MSVKLTNAQMFESLQVLSKVEEKGVLGFAIAQNRRKLTEELKEYLAKRDELLKKYGTDEGNGRFQLKAEDVPKFFEEMNPYDNMKTDINVRRVTEEQFCSGNLTSTQMFALEWMIESNM